MVINLSQYLIALLREKMLSREKIRSILNGAFHCSVGFFVVLHHIFGFIFHRWILNVFDHFNFCLTINSFIDLYVQTKYSFTMILCVCKI